MRGPAPASPGQPARVDYEYVRRGTADVFLFCKPLAGRRRLKITQRRTKVVWAISVRELVDEAHLRAEQIVLLPDNLNTHAAASLHEAFPPVEAERIADGLEIHRTSKHGSWLSRADIEPSILDRQCLDRRIDNADRPRREAAAWEKARNATASRRRLAFHARQGQDQIEETIPINSRVTERQFSPRPFLGCVMLLEA